MFKLMGRDNLLVMASMLIWALGEGLWFFVRQIYLSQLGASPVQIGTALALETIARAVVMLPAGFAIDRIGVRETLVAAWVIGVLGTVAMCFSGTWQTFTAGLFLYGLSAFALPAVSAYALASTADRRTSTQDTQQVIAIMFVVYPLGLIVSPAVGGWIGGQWGIGVCLWIALALYCISFGVISFTRHIQPHPHEGRLNIAPLLGNQHYLWRMFFFAICLSSMYLGVALLPNYMREVRRIPLETIGILFSIQSGGTVAVNLLMGRLPLRWSLPAIVLIFLAALLLIWGVPDLAAIGVAFFASGTIFVGRAVATGSIENVVMARDRGVAFSAMELSFALITSLAGQLAGILYAASDPHDLPILISASLLPLMLVLWFIMRAWQPAPHVEPGAVAATSSR